MGKINGIGGYISGKVGNIVYMKGENGETYGRTYVSNPKNPKSTAQLVQRAKMNVVGRISMLTSKALIAPLGMSGRKNRSTFTKVMLDNATVTVQNGNYVAAVEPESFIYAHGPEVLRASASAITVTDMSVTFSLTLSDESLSGKYGERIVVVAIDPVVNTGKSSVQFLDIILDNRGAATVEIPFGGAIADGYLVCVYRAPFVLSDSAVAVHSEGLYNNTTDFVAAMMANEGAFRGWGESLLVGKSVFTAA